VLVKELRAIYPSLPVVIASGHDERTLRNGLGQQQQITFLSKPYSLQQLRAVLQSIGSPRRWVA
jgi:DNA-binding NtrC family response regulator